MAHALIEIDVDVSSIINSARLTANETSNDVLRRLLGLGSAPLFSHGTSIQWSDGSVVLPNGTRLRMMYGRPKRVYVGEIRNGRWIVNGMTFRSPSGAASGVALTATGQNTRLNGWHLWEVKRPNDHAWFRLASIRSRGPGATKMDNNKSVTQFLKPRKQL